MRLEITAGPDAGKSFEPEGERFTIGREDVDLLLADDEVSRRHVELRTLPDGRLEVADLGSRNGTRVDGERLTGPRALSGGEEIVLGMTTIRVEEPPRPAAGETVVAGDATAVSPQPPADDDATAVSETPPPPPPESETAPQPVQPPTPPPPPAAAPPPPSPSPAQSPPPAAPQSPPAFQQPPAAPAGGPAQASTGKRVTALVLSILVLLGALFFILAAIVALSATPCDDVAAFAQERIADPDARCYNSSETNRVIATALIGLGSAFAVAFLVFSIGYFSKSRRGTAVLVTGVAAIVLIAVGGVLL